MTGRAGEIIGTLRRVELEGGFWGIVADDGRRLRPLNLDEHLSEPADGKRLAVRGEVEAGVVSIQMWGQAFRVEGARWLD